VVPVDQPFSAIDPALLAWPQLVNGLRPVPAGVLLGGVTLPTGVILPGLRPGHRRQIWVVPAHGAL